MTEWDITTAVYTGKSFSAAAQDTSIQDLAMSADGLTVFALGMANRRVYQYGLTVPFDLTTATYSAKSLYVGLEDTYPAGLDISPDGLHIYIAGNGTATLYEYALTGANDVSTGSYSGRSRPVGVPTGETAPTGLAFSPDGLHVYMVGSTLASIQQQTLTTAFDISTATYSGKTLGVAAQQINPNGVAISTDGLTAHVAFANGIWQYGLTAAFDISTGSYANKSLDTTARDGVASGVKFSADGTVMVMSGAVTEGVYQYAMAATPNPTYAKIGSPARVTGGNTIPHRRATGVSR